MRLYFLCEDQKNEISNLEDELYEKKDDLQTIKKAFNIIENIEYKGY